MPFLPNRLTSVAGLALLCSSCSADSPQAGTDPPVPPAAAVRLIISPSIELTNRDLNIIPEDSLIVRAVVAGNAEAYGSPVITASDTSAISTRPDGSVALRRNVSGLTLTATASARSAGTRPETLTASGRINIACTAIAIAGISVTLQDSITGLAPPVDGGPTVFRAWNATYVDSLRFPGPLTPWGAAFERAGVYSVTVDATGYLPWRRDGIEVTRGICHVHPVLVTAKLQRR
jgi:hypothetical protein